MSLWDPRFLFLERIQDLKRLNDLEDKEKNGQLLTEREELEKKDLIKRRERQKKEEPKPEDTTTE